jgi:hypothetical protein
MYYGNFTDMKGISQEFLDCGLHNDKYSRFHPYENWAHNVPPPIPPMAAWFMVHFFWQPIIFAFYDDVKPPSN